MYIPFSSLPSNARLWIYQADKILSPKQQDIISDALRSFTDQWTVHGAPMETSFQIKKDVFVMLAANDHASGCSIDSSVRAMQSLGERLGVNFFNRNLIAFEKENGVVMVKLSELKSAFEKGELVAGTLYYNNLIQTTGDLSNSWLIPSGKSWLSRYIEKQTISD